MPDARMPVIPTARCAAAQAKQARWTKYAVRSERAVSTSAKLYSVIKEKEKGSSDKRRVGVPMRNAGGRECETEHLAERKAG